MMFYVYFSLVQHYDDQYELKYIGQMYMYSFQHFVPSTLNCSISFAFCRRATGQIGEESLFFRDSSEMVKKTFRVGPF